MLLISKEAPDLRFLFETYQTCMRAITREEASYIRIIESGEKIADAHFAGMQLGELRSRFLQYRTELEYANSLTLLAGIEAIVINDFWSFRSKRGSFRSLRSQGRKLALGAILREWRILSTHIGRRDLKTAMDNFGDALKLRHWLAHGRRWHAPTSGSYPVEVIYQIGLRIDQLLHEYQ